MAEHLKADLKQAVEFLDVFYGPSPRHLVAIKPDAEGSGLEARTFKKSEGDAMYRWLDEQQSKVNCYFHVNRLKQTVKNRKATKEDVSKACFAHVDVDDPSEAALVRLTSFELPPTVIMFSGGGYQAFWRLKAPTEDFGRVEQINRALERDLGGDNCHNIDRIMRVPGTINVPNAKKRAQGRTPVLAHIVKDCEFDPTRKYALEEFPSGLLMPTVLNQPPPDDIPVLEIDEVGVPVPEALCTIATSGDDVTRPIGSEDARFPSRSEAVWYVATSLAKLGAGAVSIAGVLLNSTLGISASILESRDPKRIAFRTAGRAELAAAGGWPDVNKHGDPLRTLPNAIVALLRLPLTFEQDGFHNRKNINGHQLQVYQGDLTDDVCLVVRKLIIDEFGFDPLKLNVLDAVQILCLENWAHPILEYLDNLQWDGVPRLMRLLADYFGAEDTELNQAISKIVLVAAVRRVREPGCKFDTTLILEGKQGTGKSTALTILAGEENFSDQEILTLDSKSQMELVEGVWIYELSELEGLRHTDTGKLKAFISRAEDRGRPAYGRFRQNWPRQCIFIGTTNDDQYLKDSTGNRRFWPVSTTTINLEGLRRVRDQLWAEAAYWEGKGESLVLPEDLWLSAADQQDRRLLEDPWIEILEKVTGEKHGSVERVKTELLFDPAYLGIQPERRQAFMPKRVAQIMRKLGWTGPTKLRFSAGKIARGYERPSDDDEQEE